MPSIFLKNCHTGWTWPSDSWDDLKLCTFSASHFSHSSKWSFFRCRRSPLVFHRGVGITFSHKIHLAVSLLITSKNIHATEGVFTLGFVGFKNITKAFSRRSFCSLSDEVFFCLFGLDFTLTSDGLFQDRVSVKWHFSSNLTWLSSVIECSGFGISGGSLSVLVFEESFVPNRLFCSTEERGLIDRSKTSLCSLLRCLNIRMVDFDEDIGKACPQILHLQSLLSLPLIPIGREKYFQHRLRFLLPVLFDSDRESDPSPLAFASFDIWLVRNRNFDGDGRICFLSVSKGIP